MYALDGFFRRITGFGLLGLQEDNTPTVSQPAAAPSTSDAVKEWVAQMPAVFAEQQRQAPLEAQQQIDLLKKYGLEYSQAGQAIDQALYPQTSAIQENLAGIATQGANATSMPDWMRKQYMSDYNSQLGTNAGSPMGAEYTSRNMQQQLFGQQQYYQNMALSLAGRQPLSQQQNPQYTNYASTFTPSGVASQQSSAYNSYMPYWQNYANQQSQISMMPSQSQRAGQAWGQYFAGQNYGGL